jgi:hypothetical protein
MRSTSHDSSAIMASCYVRFCPTQFGYVVKPGQFGAERLLAPNLIRHFHDPSEFSLNEIHR